MPRVDRARILADTFAEFLKGLGDVPLDRIRMNPLPGTATEQDVTAALDSFYRQFHELVDGVLIERPSSLRRSIVAGRLTTALLNHDEDARAGVTLNCLAPVRLLPSVVRIPDAYFTPFGNIPGRRLRDMPIWTFTPSLVAEVLTTRNTPTETERRLNDYFRSGVALVWLLDPIALTAEAYTAAGRKQRLRKSGKLDGAPALPGLSVPLSSLFVFSQRKLRKG